MRRRAGTTTPSLAQPRTPRGRRRPRPHRAVHHDRPACLPDQTQRLIEDLDEDTRAAWLTDYTKTVPGPRVLRLAKGLEA